MIEVELHTARGDYVTTVEIPPFQAKPDVLVWGARTFILSNDQYNEAFSYHVIIEDNGSTNQKENTKAD